jgi:hypothetical protein
MAAAAAAATFAVFFSLSVEIDKFFLSFFK